MPTKNRAWRLAACVVPLLIAGLLIFSYMEVYRQRSEAEQFLALLKRIEVGTTKQDAVLDSASPFRDHIEESAEGGLPQINFWFDNRALERLHLVSHSRFAGHIVFKNGIAVEKLAYEFVSASGCTAKVTENVRGFGFADGAAPANHPNHYVGHNWNPGNHVRGIFVTDDNTLEVTQRVRDWNFDLSCLAALNDCSDARKMLPDIRISEPKGDAR